VSVLSQEQIESVVKTLRQSATRNEAGKQRSVYACNFRSAGRLSNENARSLTAAHETFARHLASVLDAYLGTGLEVKLQTLDQLPIKEHIASIPPLTYIAPFSLTTMPSTMIVECDIGLVFPIIDVLLGGTGASESNPRELSEIEEEIMQDVTSLIARQAESAWHMPAMSLAWNRRIKSSVLHQYCPPNEKVTRVRFEIEIAGVTGSFQLVFPTSFVNILIKQIKLEDPQKKGGIRYFPTPSIRERILDCDVMVAADLPGMKVAVRDLLALQPGCVLKLRAPVRNPGMLTVGGREIFEAVPVRNGSQKAAQLGRRTQFTNWGRE
jgi:flagellar motor switch protein FliM